MEKWYIWQTKNCKKNIFDTAYLINICVLQTYTQRQEALKGLSYLNNSLFVCLFNFNFYFFVERKKYQKIKILQSRFVIEKVFSQVFFLIFFFTKELICLWVCLFVVGGNIIKTWKAGVFFHCFLNTNLNFFCYYFLNNKSDGL